jgi:hypothetical protein
MNNGFENAKDIQKPEDGVDCGYTEFKLKQYVDNTNAYRVEKLGGLSEEVIVATLKEKYPENFL